MATRRKRGTDTYPAVTDARSFLAAHLLPNRVQFVIRAIRPDDKGRILAAFDALDDNSIYMRFFGYKKGLTESELAQATGVDFEHVVALVATVGCGEDERIIAGGRYIAEMEPDRGNSAELAFIVVKEYRGLGIAQHLLRHLVRIARSKGLSRLEADVLVANRPMLLVLARSGLPMTQHRSGDVAHVTLLL